MKKEIFMLPYFYMPSEARGMSSNWFSSCGSPKLLKFLRFLLVLVDHLGPLGFHGVPRGSLGFLRVP